MNRASPVDMRKALETVHTYRQAGILFVPIPVLDDSDHAALIKQAAEKIEKIMETVSQ